MKTFTQAVLSFVLLLFMAAPAVHAQAFQPITVDPAPGSPCLRTQDPQRNRYSGLLWACTNQGTLLAPNWEWEEIPTQGSSTVNAAGFGLSLNGSTMALNTAVGADHTQIENNEVFVNSATGSTSYAGSLPAQALPALQAGQLFWLVTDTSSSTTATLQIDSTAATTLTLSDGATAVGNAVVAGVPYAVYYDGTVFRLANVGPRAFTALTDGATVTLSGGAQRDVNRSLTFTAHSGSRTLNVSGLVNGGSYVVELFQDATGGEGLTLGSGCTWLPSSVTLTTNANGLDVMAFTYDGTRCIQTLKNYR